MRKRMKILTFCFAFSIFVRKERAFSCFTIQSFFCGREGISSSTFETKAKRQTSNCNGCSSWFCSSTPGNQRRPLRRAVESAFRSLFEQRINIQEQIRTLKEEEKSREEEMRVFVSLENEVLEREGAEDGCMLYPGLKYKVLEDLRPCLWSVELTRPLFEVVCASK